VTLGVFSVTFFILNRPVKHWEEAGDETVAGRDSYTTNSQTGSGYSAPNTA